MLDFVKGIKVSFRNKYGGVSICKKKIFVIYYVSWKNTLSENTFYVNFIREGAKKYPYLGLYEVEKEAFLFKMQEWGVELENMRQEK